MGAATATTPTTTVVAPVEGRTPVSVVVPAFNEAAILRPHLVALREHLRTLEDRFAWDVVVVDDGSTDGTGAIADACACELDDVVVVHHPINRGLGQALRTAFERCRGTYVVVLDVDLSYTPDHVERLLDAITRGGAQVVVASPYCRGGSTANVPWARLLTSRWANRLLSVAATGKVHTLTGMVRAYEAAFLRRLDLRGVGMEINPEILYKALLLDARVEEIPARLAWIVPTDGTVPRMSKMRAARQTAYVLRTGFLFRPVTLFLAPGVATLMFAVWVGAWIVSHFLQQLGRTDPGAWFFDRASTAIAAAYAAFPHTFVVGGIAMTLGIQLVGLGMIALQNRAYFEELYHQGSSTRAARSDEARHG